MSPLTNLGVSRAARRSERTCKERLTRTGWAVEENTARRDDAKLLEQLGVQERQRNHFLELIDVVVEATDSVERDVDVDAQGINVGIRC